MDFLEEVPCALTPSVSKSPFWRKTYGGYTRGQVDYISRTVEDLGQRSVYDPMSGQAFSACQICWAGSAVYLSDINPGALCLASLRDPAMIKTASTLSENLRHALLSSRVAKKAYKAEYCAEWISPRITSDLQRLFVELGVDFKRTPFSSGRKFWAQSKELRLVTALAVLAARRLTCFRATDNRTWLRKGGVTPNISCVGALLEALESWSSFAAAVARTHHKLGKLNISTWDISQSPNEAVGLVDTVIVSPPYANRLDYSSLWAPETALLSGVFATGADHIKLIQVGTTMVRGNKPTQSDLDGLPTGIRRVLLDILGHSSYASERYYFPYFANYALSLSRSIANWSAHLKPRGYLIVLVRDTVRKDNLFPTDLLVREVAEQHGLRSIEAESKGVLIRSHIGFVRKRHASLGIRGLAQQEWWLKFVKI